MASRFWVGGAGTWDGASTTHWSASSGGASGASVPIATDDVFFNGSSGGGAVTISGTRVGKSLTCTGFTGSFTGGTLQISGNVTLVAGMTTDGTTQFTVDGATCSFASGGKQIAGIDIGNTVFTLSDDLSCVGGINFLNTGTFDANNKNVTAAGFTSNVSTTRTITMGSGTWTFTGTPPWNVTYTNLTLNVGTAKIKLSGSTQTFDGSNRTFDTVWVTGSGAGPFTIQNVTCTFKDDNATAHTATLAPGSGTISLGAALTNSALTLAVTSGTFNAAGYAATLKAFSATGSPTLSLGAGTITLSGTGTVWDLSSAGGATVTGGAIAINDATAASKTFKGGSKSYTSLRLTGAGTGAFVITGSNTFGTFTVDTPPHDVQFEAGSITTATSFSFDGSAAAGNNVLEGVGGGTWDIVCIAGVSASYVALQGSHAHGGAFTATNSFDAGDNLFWTFVHSASDVVYFDAAYQYSGSAISIVEGLNWLWGETVGVLADGVDVGDATVSTAGKLTLPGGITAAHITLGKRYRSRAVTLRAPMSGNQDGSALGRKMTISSVAIDMLESAGIYAGTLQATRPVPPAWKQTASGDLYTGLYDVPSIDKHSNGGVVVFETDAGYAATVRAVQFAIEGEP